MSEHHSAISWQRSSEDFTYDTYNRDHLWVFPGGQFLQGSAAPEFKGDPKSANPEEAFVAAASSCHMLTFLAIAARKRLVVDQYNDHAVGFLEKNAAGKLVITRIILRPEVVFGEGTAVSAEELEKLHHSAHEHCFIANSITAEITVESV